MGRSASLLLASVAAGTARRRRTRPALIERLTGPSSRLETDLRVLTDEIGGRVTGSAGVREGAAVGRGGVPPGRGRFGEARVLPDPGELGGDLGHGLASSRPALSAARRLPRPRAVDDPAPDRGLVDVGDGRRADFERLGAKARGAIVLVALEADEVLRRPLRRVPARPRDDAGGGGRTGGGAPVHLDAARGTCSTGTR